MKQLAGLRPHRQAGAGRPGCCSTSSWRCCYGAAPFLRSSATARPGSARVRPPATWPAPPPFGQTWQACPASTWTPARWPPQIFRPGCMLWPAPACAGCASICPGIRSSPSRAPIRGPLGIASLPTSRPSLRCSPWSSSIDLPPGRVLPRTPPTPWRHRRRGRTLVRLSLPWPNATARRYVTSRYGTSPTLRRIGVPALWNRRLSGVAREAAVNIRQAGPQAQIVLAAPTRPTRSRAAPTRAMSPTSTRLYSLGARTWFDIAASEPYGFSLPPAARPTPKNMLDFGRAASLRQVMLRHGDTGTPLWATSFGWNALPSGWSGPASPWGQVTSASRRAMPAWRWLRPGRPGPGWGHFSGLPTARCAPPATLSQLILCLAGGAAGRSGLECAHTAPVADPVLPPGEHAPNHPALHYGPG